jgi:chromosome segregation ATPase
LTSDLTDIPGRVQAELTRLRAEREVFAAEQARLQARLTEAEQALRTAKIDQIASLEQRHDELAARVAALEADVATARRERDSLRSELSACRQERDRIRLRLLDAELALSLGDGEVSPVESPAAEQRAIAAEQRAGELARELAATQATLSWRVTRPLRAVRRKIPR